MNIRYIILLLIAISNQVNAQADTSKSLQKPDICRSSVAIELMGNTSVANLSYENIMVLSKNFGLTGSLGYLYMPKYGKNLAYQNVVIGTNFLIRKEAIKKSVGSKKKSKNQKKVSYAELGFYHVFQFPNQGLAQPWNNIYLGYNAYPLKKYSGLYCRIGFVLNIYKPGGKDRNSSLPISPIPIPRICIGITF